MASCGPDISRLKIATGKPISTPTCSAIFKAKAVLPIDAARRRRSCRRLQSRCHSIEVDEAGRHACYVGWVFLFVQLLDAVDDFPSSG